MHLTFEQNELREILDLLVKVQTLEDLDESPEAREVIEKLRVMLKVEL